VNMGHDISVVGYTMFSLSPFYTRMLHLDEKDSGNISISCLAISFYVHFDLI